MTEIAIIAAAGFVTGITTIMFGFGGGFVVVPFVYHLVASSGMVESGGMHVAVATSTAVMIFNAGYATWLNARRGNLVPETISPLIHLIALGAILGAFAATLLEEEALRLLFILYLLATIADCLFRDGFLSRPEKRALSGPTLIIGGPLIGSLATMLGVGGSVMTVPLLRRHGHAMKHCVSAANPLSIPVAMLGSAMYAWLGWGKGLGAEYLGYINLRILGVLVLSGIAGIVFAKTLIPDVDDRVHARVYLFLLVLVLVAICIGG